MRGTTSRNMKAWALRNRRLTHNDYSLLCVWRANNAFRALSRAKAKNLFRQRAIFRSHYVLDDSTLVSTPWLDDAVTERIYLVSSRACLSGWTMARDVRAQSTKHSILRTTQLPSPIRFIKSSHFCWPLLLDGMKKCFNLIVSRTGQCRPRAKQIIPPIFQHNPGHENVPKTIFHQAKNASN